MTLKRNQRPAGADHVPCQQQRAAEGVGEAGVIEHPGKGKSSRDADAALYLGGHHTGQADTLGNTQCTPNPAEGHDVEDGEIG